MVQLFLLHSVDLKSVPVSAFCNCVCLVLFMRYHYIHSDRKKLTNANSLYRYINVVIKDYFLEFCHDIWSELK